MFPMDVVFSEELIKKYDRPGPRYTSYPPATEFSEKYGRDYYIKHLIESNRVGKPLSLYFHIPFCENACWFCGCNVVINRIRGREVPYLKRLEKEISYLKGYLDTERPVVQLHWGGRDPQLPDDGADRRFVLPYKGEFQPLARCGDIGGD